MEILTETGSVLNFTCHRFSGRYQRKPAETVKKQIPPASAAWYLSFDLEVLRSSNLFGYHRL
jgi:hypothetical protein